MPFTEEQLQAIDFRKGNCLVSAGAGSGKTAVLTERIYQLIAEREEARRSSGGDSLLPHLLVLTFTNKAAYEMKDRVRSKIASSPYSALSPEVEQAQITTFDAFALALVKTYHYALGIDRDVTIVDQTILEVEKKRILNDIVERRSEKAEKGEDPDWASLVRAYCIKNTDDLRTLILDTQKALCLEQDKEEFLDHYDITHFSDASFQAMLSEFDETIYGLARDYLVAMEREYDDPIAFEADRDAIQHILDFHDHDTLCSFLNGGFKMPIYNAKKGWTQDKDVRDRLKKRYCDDIKKLAQYGSRGELRERFEAIRPFARTVIEIVRELDARLSDFERIHAAYDFSDIAALAREAASIPEIQKKLREQYEYILIDEYQDTSDLQEGLISLIANENVFMVGDMKQSIYRFRNANPSIFQRKLEAYGKGEGGTLITLPDNFRSRRQVIEDINSIFGAIMSKSLGGVDYRDHQALRFGNASFNASEQNEAYGTEVIRFDHDPMKPAGKEHAEVVLRDIERKMRKGYLVLDSKTKKPRPCRYGDFAILLRAKRDFTIYAKLFNEAGIPLYVSDAPSINREDLLIAFRSLCELPDQFSRPKKDEGRIKHLYASLSRSFLAKKEDRAIASSLANGEYRKDPLLESLERNARSLCEGNLVDSLKWLLRESRFLERMLSLQNVQANAERIEHLLSLAENGSSIGWRLPEWNEYLRDIDRFDVSLALDAGGEEKDAVRIMSIHASKGLQFPIVYFPRLQSQFRPQGAGTIRYSKKYGIILPSYAHIEQNPGSIASYLDKRSDTMENLSEMMRLLYVALTRVEETMVLLKPVSEEEGKKARSVESSKSFADFLSFASFSPRIETADSPFEFRASSEGEAPRKSLRLCSISDIATVNELPRPSKAMTHPVDEGSLRYGEALHRLLEVADFQEDEFPWASPAEQEKIKKVFATPLFARRKEAKSFHEYDFVNPSTGVHGTIDLLMVYEDHIDIIDYKSSNIDDPNYDKQLQAYEAYIKQVMPGKPIRKFLLSIAKETYREVE